MIRGTDFFYFSFVGILAVFPVDSRRVPLSNQRCRVFATLPNVRTFI